MNMIEALGYITLYSLAGVVLSPLGALLDKLDNPTDAKPNLPFLLGWIVLWPLGVPLGIFVFWVLGLAELKNYKSRI